MVIQSKAIVKIVITVLVQRSMISLVTHKYIYNHLIVQGAKIIQSKSTTSATWSLQLTKFIKSNTDDNNTIVLNHQLYHRLFNN